MTEHLAGGADRLGVGVRSPMKELAIVQTSFEVQRWDDDQTAWALRKLGYSETRPPMPGDRGLTPAQFASAGVTPYSVTREDNCNMILQAGWVALLGGIAGTSITTKFSATVGRICIGDSATAAAYGQTDLQAATNKYYQLVSGAPVISTGSTPPALVFAASFGTGVANYQWQEFATDEGTTSTTGPVVAVCLNRGVSNQGTKASGQTWSATQTISFGYPSGSGTVG